MFYNNCNQPFYYLLDYLGVNFLFPKVKYLFFVSSNFLLMIVCFYIFFSSVIHELAFICYCTTIFFKKKVVNKREVTLIYCFPVFSSFPNLISFRFSLFIKFLCNYWTRKQAVSNLMFIILTQ